jgi:hypothetical protein
MASKRTYEGEVVDEDTRLSRNPDDAEELFKGDVHQYGKWLVESCQAVSSWHDTSNRMKEYQEYLCANGTEYRDDVMHNNAVIKALGGGDMREIFLAEQEMRARTVGGSRGFYSPSETKNPLREETVLGLGEHKGVSILRKYQHAPIPWDSVLTVNGDSLRATSSSSTSRSHEPAINNQLGGDGRGVCQLLDPVMEKVLYGSTKRDHLISILQGLQSFYIPEGRTTILDTPLRFLSTVSAPRRTTMTTEKRKRWEEFVKQHGPLHRFLPRAFVSWVDHFVSENVSSLPLDDQIRFLKTLLRMYESARGSPKHGETARRRKHKRMTKRKELQTIPVVLDMRVETFYTFIKTEYGLSAHIVDKDPSRQVAVVSFELTHRYILAIFLDIRPVSFHRTQYRLCNYMLDYLGLISRAAKTQTKDSDVAKMVKTHRAALSRVAEQTLRECPPLPGTEEARGSGQLMRNMLERRSGAEAPASLGSSRGKKSTEACQRKKKILATRTTGIIDVAIYPCVCRRS